MPDGERIDFGFLEVGDVIVHFVPPPGDEHPPLRLSSNVSPLQVTTVRQLIRSRIVDSLKSKPLYIRFDEERIEPARDHICTILGGGTEDLVEGSRVLARHLYGVQPRNASSSILLFSRADTKGRPGLAIMKMEPQDGASLEWAEDICEIHQIDELMLTKQTRLYKIGFFAANPADETDPVGLISDLQTTKRRSSAYFLQRFLGCKFAQNPEEITRTLFGLSTEFINEIVINPDDQMKYALSLLTEFDSNERTISPETIAARHFSEEHQSSYEAYLQVKGIDPRQTYRKDTRLIAKKIKILTMEFAGGNKITGTPESFENHVSSRTLVDGQVEVTLVDRLKEIKK